MPRVPAKSRARSRRRWQRRERFWFKSRSGCAHARCAGVFYQQLRVLSIQGHSINRRLVFIFLLHDAKELVVAQPERLPNEIILTRNTDCFFTRDIEFFDRRLWTVPVLALMLGAAIDIHQQHLAIRRNTQSIAAV